MGDPNNFAKKYYQEGVDEILYIDTVASLYGRNNLHEIVKKTIEEVFVPITVAGGIRNFEDAKKLIVSGADKISLNSALIENPKLLDELSKKIGSSNITVSIEAKKINDDDWEVFTLNGRERSNINILRWIETINRYNFGEILLTSIDQDGTKKGFDYQLIELVKKNTHVPLIASGGFGKLEHLDELLSVSKVEGIAIGSAFHYNLITIKQLKEYMLKKNYKVRIQ